MTTTDREFIDNLKSYCQQKGIVSNAEEIQDVRRCVGGIQSNVHEIICDSRSLIFKSYPSFRMKKEFFVYNFISREIPEFPVPMILAHEPHGVLKEEFLIMNKVIGNLHEEITLPICEGASLHQESRNLEPHILFSTYEQLGSLLATVHSTDVGPRFGEISSDTKSLASEFTSNGDLINSLFNTSLALFHSLNGSEQTIELINDFLSKNQHFLHSCQIPCLCHNDFYEGNIIFNKVKVTGIIDVRKADLFFELTLKWELAIAADPYFDLAKVFLYAIKQDRQKEMAFMIGYTSKIKLAEDFTERMRVYTVFHLLEQWIFHAQRGNNQFLDSIQATLVNKLL